jgi:arginyl-tRNA synthetase
MIGQAALKYFMLKVEPSKNMMFNPRESIDFDGNTGPFIQYTHARIRSLIRKSGMDLQTFGFLESPQLQPEERNLLVLCYDYLQVLSDAASGRNPGAIANYVYELARAYNQFYQKVPVLKESDEALLKFRLKLSERCAALIHSCMALLGIEVPEKM